MLTLDKVYQAAHVLRDVVRTTNVIPTHNLAPQCDLHLKAENLQVTGSFKVRGATFKIAGLTEEERSRGVIACSAGNHAQGVALAAQKTGTAAKIFLPATAPLSKVEATEALGAQIVLVDGVYDDAFDAAIACQQETGAVFIHPFDDIDVIAGQGTIGLELMEQIPDMDAVVVPVGGGGLISGIAYVVKSLNPQCKVYGVQAQGAGSMTAALQHHERSALSHISTFADGIAVKCPGEYTYSICADYVDDMVTVSDDEIAAAILALMEQQKLVAEGAGAVAIAAVMYDKLPLAGKKVCAVISGGNIDVNILSRVIDRGLLMSGRRGDLTLELLDKPGQLKEVSAIISDLGANVTKVLHNPGGENTDINGCYLSLSLETRNYEHLRTIENALKAAGYKLTDNR
ncbi:MAG: threonine ammonia-lyase [Coriobacteriia bacterium]|nr:threonine ammonia-lyase [Coriobacteriia bacterium]